MSLDAVAINTHAFSMRQAFLPSAHIESVREGVLTFGPG